MRVYIIIGQNVKLNKDELSDGFIIGVDKGAISAIDNDIELDLAIGDFDSITDDEFLVVKKCCKNVIKLNPIKDLTDTEEAINYAKKISEEIFILGGIQGKRIEHFLANLNLLIKNPSIKLVDSNSFIYTTKNDVFIDNDIYKYISIFAIEDSIISLNGFKYNLDSHLLRRFDSLCVSNEVVSIGHVNIESGNIIIIKSKDDIEL